MVIPQLPGTGRKQGRGSRELARPAAAAERSKQVNAVWVRSSRSFSNGNCVEVAELPGGSVGVRNSRDPDGPVLKFTQAEWGAFLGGARLGEFDWLSTAYRPGPDSAPAEPA